MPSKLEQLLGAGAGSVVTVRPDWALITDGPTHRAVEEIRTVAAPEKVLVIFDHDVPTGSPEAAAILGKINRFAHQYGCRFVQSVGVGARWMLQEGMVQPGQILIGGRHSSVFGAVGALGLHLNTLELARAVENGYYSFIVPETVTVELTGILTGSALDAAFTVLSRLGDVKGKAIEFTGGESLTDTEKAKLCGLACETGAFTALFGESKTPALQVELGSVVPMVRMPAASREAQDGAAILPRAAVSGIRLNAGQLSGFTGGTIADLRRAARLMEGKTLARGFRLSIVPATTRDYLEALNEGIVERFIDFGAQIHAAGERSVIWQGPGVIDRGERLVTTGLYSFDGCMGVPGSFVYNASVETVIEAASTRQL